MKKRLLTAFSLLAFSFIILLCCIWFTYAKTIFSMIILFALIIVWLILYLPCIKAMTLPEGYTILQAVMFYRKCVKKGIYSYDQIKIKRNRLFLKHYLQKKGIETDLDVNGLWKMYCDGKEVCSLIGLKSK